MRRECRERFPRHRLKRKPLVSDPGMHHGTCVTHMSTGVVMLVGIANPRWLGKRSRHSRRMRNPHFYVSDKRPILRCLQWRQIWHHDDSRVSVYVLVFNFQYHTGNIIIIVRRAGLLLSQQDFEWRWSVPLFQCLTVLEFSFILFDLCLLITFFNFIMNYVPIVTFWIFTYHKIWILSIMFCFIWSYWIIYFLACL